MHWEMLLVVAVSAVVLTAAYCVYGPLLSRLLQLDPRRATPSEELRDDVDYVPTSPNLLLGQHFSAIAAAGPIVGPILAGVAFGWLPALIWILIGSIFLGGVHDMTALVASIRHRADSIAMVVRDHMSQRVYILFLLFVWLALVYIVVAFTDITSASFLGRLELENGEVVSGPGTASSSLMYLALPIAMGLLMRYAKLSVGWATIIFLPLVGAAIWAGQKFPFDVQQMLDVDAVNAKRVWNVGLLTYCFIASMIPVWLLLQPRGLLGGYFLYVALAGGAIGLLVAGKPIEYPSFTGWTSKSGQPLFPMLFVMIACGACSGFHALIASGTTSKQLRRETDAKLIGYGSMLLEAMVAIVSLCCVMMLAPSDPLLAGTPQPNLLYAKGMSNFLAVLGVRPELGVTFGLLAFTTFVYDTLDVCTRLGRYILEELTGWRNVWGRAVATGVTAAAPLYFLLQDNGAGPPAWRVFWDLFGASNQLLAALTLMGVTIWLWNTRRVVWAWFVTGLPAAWMYVMSTWALTRIILSQHFVVPVNSAAGFSAAIRATFANPVALIAVVLVILALWMLVEAVILVVVRRHHAAAA